MSNEPGPIKIFQKWDSEIRATRAASFRLGHRQKESIGEYFWCDDRVPGIAFKTRQECMSAIKNKVQNDQRKEV